MSDSLKRGVVRGTRHHIVREWRVDYGRGCMCCVEAMRYAKRVDYSSTHRHTHTQGERASERNRSKLMYE